MADKTFTEICDLASTIAMKERELEEMQEKFRRDSWLFRTFLDRDNGNGRHGLEVSLSVNSTLSILRNDKDHELNVTNADEIVVLSADETDDLYQLLHKAFGND